MKHISLFTLFFVVFLNQKTIAQDIIKFKNGDELKVKVQEITPQEIKYKRFDNPTGPLITILKNTVSSLRYENGTSERLDDSPVASNSTDFTNPEGFGVGDIIATDYYGTEYKGKVVSVNKNRLTAVVVIDKNRNKETLNRQFHELTLVEKIAVPVNNYVGQPITQNSTELLAQGQRDASRYYNSYHGAGTGTFVTALLFGPIIGLIPAAACSSTTPSQDRLSIPNPQLAQNSIYLTGYTQEAHRIKSRKVWGNFAIGSVVSIIAVVVLTSQYR